MALDDPRPILVIQLSAMIGWGLSLTAAAGFLIGLFSSWETWAYGLLFPSILTGLYGLVIFYTKRKVHVQYWFYAAIIAAACSGAGASKYLIDYMAFIASTCKVCSIYEPDCCFCGYELELDDDGLLPLTKYVGSCADLRSELLVCAWFSGFAFFLGVVVVAFTWTIGNRNEFKDKEWLGTSVF